MLTSRKTALVMAAAFLALSSSAYASDHLKVKIETLCKKGTAIFKVRNEGERWPKAGRFEVYSIEDKSLISQRKFRLAAGQKATFRVKDVADEYGAVGLWIEPSWFTRQFKYDATVTCE